MNKEQFHTALEHINHSQERRNFFADLMLNQKVTVPEVIEVLREETMKNSYKAAWVLEFACKKEIGILLPFLDAFIPLLPIVKKDSALRPLAKICETLILEYYHQKNPLVIKHLNTMARQNISEACFDWMITDQKVAVKAYAIICLFHLGKEFDWIHPELKNILEEDYHKQSAAFKARARMVLKKMK